MKIERIISFVTDGTKKGNSKPQKTTKEKPKKTPRKQSNEI